MTTLATQDDNSANDRVLSYFVSTSDERRRLEVETARREESRRLGALLCETINELLSKKDGLKFKSDVDRLYFDETFSFETFKYPSKENEDKLNVLIRIKPRDAPQINDDVQPGVSGAVATIKIENRSEKLILNVFGEANLEGLDPGILCRFAALKADSSTKTVVVSKDGDRTLF